MTTGPIAGRVPFYARNPADGSIYLIGGVNRLNDLADTDTQTTWPADGEALVWSDAVQQWIPGQVATGDVPDEVWIGASGPTGPDAELWYDPSADAVAPTAGNEVHIGDTDPRLDPLLADVELWADTSSDPAALKFWDGAAWVAAFVAPPAETSVPTGGVTGRVLRKVSDADGDVGWDGDVRLSKNLTVQDNVTVIGDARGYWMAGGGGIWKKSGTGIVLRRAANSPSIQVEDSNGGNVSDVITTATGDARYLRSTNTTLGLITQAHGWTPTPVAGQVIMYSVFTNDGRQEVRALWDSGASTAFTFE